MDNYMFDALIFRRCKGHHCFGTSTPAALQSLNSSHWCIRITMASRRERGHPEWQAIIAEVWLFTVGML